MRVVGWGGGGSGGGGGGSSRESTLVRFLLHLPINGSLVLSTAESYSRRKRGQVLGVQCYK